MLAIISYSPLTQPLVTTNLLLSVSHPALGTLHHAQAYIMFSLLQYIEVLLLLNQYLVITLLYYYNYIFLTTEPYSIL